MRNMARTDGGFRLCENRVQADFVLLIATDIKCCLSCKKLKLAKT